MNNLDERILNTVREKNIRPKPRWIFTLREYGILFALSIAILLASFGIMLTFYLLTHGDFLFARIVSGGVLPHFMHLSGPTIFGSSILALTLATYAFYKRKYGYRTSEKKVFTLFIFLSLLLGGILFLRVQMGGENIVPSRFSNFLEREVSRNWQNPKAGFLIGTILNQDGNVLTVIDRDGTIWNVQLSEEIDEMDRFIIEHASQIIFAGGANGHTFTACAVRPFQKRSLKKLLKKVPQSETNQHFLRKYRCKERYQ